MNIAVVTGASSGLGREFVKQISERYKSIEEIWVLARRRERLISLSDEIKNVKIRPIVCDLSKDEDISGYKELLETEKPFIRVLVNSAGYGIIGKFDEIAVEQNTGMCDINISSLTKIAHISIPYMKGKKANMINLASSAAFLPQPDFAVYAATKSYVLSLSRALNRELKNDGITVTAVCPGPVNTEFFDIAEQYHQVKLYKKLLRANADKVVKKALEDSYYGLTVSVYGPTMNALRLITKLGPADLLLKFF